MLLIQMANLLIIRLRRNLLMPLSQLPIILNRTFYFQLNNFRDPNGTNGTAPGSTPGASRPANATTNPEDQPETDEPEDPTSANDVKLRTLLYQSFIFCTNTKISNYFILAEGVNKPFISTTTLSSDTSKV